MCMHINGSNDGLKINHNAISLQTESKQKLNYCPRHAEPCANAHGLHMGMHVNVSVCVRVCVRACTCMCVCEHV